MKKALNTLEKIIKRDGIIAVALMLGHSDTARLKRWIVSSKIPDNQLGAIQIILDMKGES